MLLTYQLQLFDRPMKNINRTYSVRINKRGISHKCLALKGSFTTYYFPLWMNMIHGREFHKTCKSFIQPKIIPPFHCNQVSKPLKMDPYNSSGVQCQLIIMNNIIILISLFDTTILLDRKYLRCLTTNYA